MQVNIISKCHITKICKSRIKVCKFWKLNCKI